jgi:predicted ribosomally synthesized peptide with nif11-like leader
MSQTELSRFISALQGDQKLAEEMANAGGDPVEFAKSKGFDITATELVRYQAEKTLELSDEELEQAAGGITPLLTTPFYTATPALIGGAAAGGAAGAIAATTATVC